MAWLREYATRLDCDRARPGQNAVAWNKGNQIYSRYSRATSDEPARLLARIVALSFEGVARTFAVCRRTP